MPDQSNDPATTLDVAKWMVQALGRVDFLYQEDVVHEIVERFGQRFTYDNENGNLAIDRKVLEAFRKLTGDSVIWESGERMWRKRQDYDEPGKRKQY